MAVESPLGASDTDGSEQPVLLLTTSLQRLKSEESTPPMSSPEDCLPATSDTNPRHSSTQGDSFSGQPPGPLVLAGSTDLPVVLGAPPIQ